MNKTRTKRVFRKHTATQQAYFLAGVTASVHTFSHGGDMQEEFYSFYETLLSLLHKHYPERSVTVTSDDPPYVTRAVKSILGGKNKLMRSSHNERAAAFATKIGTAIKRYNSA